MGGAGEEPGEATKAPAGATCPIGVTLGGEELRDTGSGSMVLVTGLGLNVTLRAVLGRGSEAPSRGVRSEVDLELLLEVLLDPAADEETGVEAIARRYRVPQVNGSAPHRLEENRLPTRARA